MQRDGDSLQDWPGPLLAAGVTPESLQLEKQGESQQETGDALLAGLSVHQELRKAVVEGLCLLRIAAYRLHRGSTLDEPRARSIVTLVKEKLHKTASLVSPSDFSKMRVQ